MTTPRRAAIWVGTAVLACAALALAPAVSWAQGAWDARQMQPKKDQHPQQPTKQMSPQGQKPTQAAPQRTPHPTGGQWSGKPAQPTTTQMKPASPPAVRHVPPPHRPPAQAMVPPPHPPGPRPGYMGAVPPPPPPPVRRAYPPVWAAAVPLLVLPPLVHAAVPPPPPPVPAYGTRMVVAHANSLKVRNCPSQQCEVISSLARGTLVELLEYRARFALVRVAGTAYEGWVHYKYLALAP